jgi:hypothetical protein
MFSEFFRSLPRILLTVVLVASGLVALFIALWIAVMLVIGLAIYIGVRRLLGGGKPPAAVIEGEFKVEDEPPQRLR